MTPSATLYTDVATVKAALGLTPYDSVDEAWLELTVAAVNCAVAYWRPDLTYSRCGDCGKRGAGGQYVGSDFVPADFVSGFTKGCHPDGQYAGANFDPAQYYTGGVWMYRGDPLLTWGATQLATRWYSRRNATEMAAFSEFGGPPPNIDRDIEVSLGIGRGYRPAIA